MAESEAEQAPAVICVGSDEFRAHTGRAWRLVASGATIRVSDRRSGEVLGYLTRSAPAALAALDGALPDPRESADSLGPEPVPEPGDWTVREVPEEASAA